MAHLDVSELLESAAPPPRADLDVGDIARRAHRRRRRRHAAVGTASVAAAIVAVGLAVQLLPVSDQRDVVVAGPGSPPAIPLEPGPAVVTARLTLLDGSVIELTLPDDFGAGLGTATVADLELHGSVHDEAGTGWRIDVTMGSVEDLLPGAEHFAVPDSAAASAVVVDRPGRRLGLQFGSWALVASGDSLSDDDVDTLVSGLALTQTAEGFVEYRGSLRLWVVDSPDLVMRGEGVAVSVFLRQCTAPVPASQTAGGLAMARVDDANRATRLTVLCDRTNRIEVGIDAARHLTDAEADRVDVDVVRAGPTSRAVQDPTSSGSSPGRPPGDGAALECGTSQPEYVDGVGDGGGEDLPSDATAEDALRRYVVDSEASLPDSGYVRLGQPDGDQGQVDFVFVHDGRRTAQVHVQRLPGGRWRALGHAQCR